MKRMIAEALVYLILVVGLLCLLESCQGATGSAQRTMAANDSISGIVLQVALGAKDVIASTDRTSVAGSRVHVVGSPQLTIDGEPAEGWRAWAKAGFRVGGYVLDWRTDGSVEYDYRLRVRGYNVWRRTKIEDGHVLLTTATGWVETVQVTGRITRRIPINVRIVIIANESVSGTVLVGTATGFADTSAFHCPIVRRIAEQRAAAELSSGLAAVLWRIEQGGTELYLAGDAGRLTDVIRMSVRIGRLRQ